MRRAALLATLVLAGCGGGGGDSATRTSAPPPKSALTVTSPAFREGADMPTRFSCDGRQVSPPLRFATVPAGSKELVLTMEDPDAPNGTFVHWLVTNLPPRARGLAEGRVPPAAVQLQQSFGERRYGGPCPPEDDPPHHYVFTLYSLDRKLALAPSASPDEVRSKVQRAATARGTLRATYGR
jgi:Raf kinase inhibitor-like YbhB/YbcL family protein